MSAIPRSKTRRCAAEVGIAKECDAEAPRCSPSSTQDSPATGILGSGAVLCWGLWRWRELIWISRLRASRKERAVKPSGLDADQIRAGHGGVECPCRGRSRPTQAEELLMSELLISELSMSELLMSEAEVSAADRGWHSGSPLGKGQARMAAVRIGLFCRCRFAVRGGGNPASRPSGRLFWLWGPDREWLVSRLHDDRLPLGCFKALASSWQFSGRKRISGQAAPPLTRGCLPKVTAQLSLLAVLRLSTSLWESMAFPAVGLSMP